MATRFQREATSEFAITATTPTSVMIGASVHSSSVLVAHDRPPQHWPVTCFADIDGGAVAPAAVASNEIVLIGTGRSLRFPKVDALRPLIEAQIGFEVMATDAACRTYNLLLAEGRAVAALLLIEANPAS
ncbi:MAG: hypothetical protein JNL19_02385 [Burkholderiales bacterium]|nr:hypothetical protein [Burkholderiales bacterium]